MVYRNFSCFNQPFEEIATYLGVTRERIRQIEGKALKKLEIRLSQRHLKAIQYHMMISTILQLSSNRKS